MRRFNFTGRRRINQSDISVRLQPDSRGLEFEARFDARHLAREHSLPDDARIIVEAYNSTKFQRFDYGLLGTMSSRRHRLSQFGSSERLLFRIKVVDTTALRAGRVLAMASAVTPVTPGESAQQSLLPVSVEAFDGLVYKVRFDEEEGPILVLNAHLETAEDQNVKVAARTPVFMSLVYPQAVREILTRVLTIDGFDDDDREDGGEDGAVADWRSRWMRYAEALNPEPRPAYSPSDASDPPAGVLGWIDTVVGEVGRQFGAVEKFGQWMVEHR